MLNQPPSRRLAIFASGIWLFASGLFSAVIGAEEFFSNFDLIISFFMSWFFVGVMPLGLAWGAAWVVSGYRHERGQVAIAQPRNMLLLERSRTDSGLRQLFAQHPTRSVLGAVVIVIAMAIMLMPWEASQIEYKNGFGDAFVYTLTSPIHALTGAIGTLIFARIIVAPWQRYWVSYRTTLLAQLWTGSVLMLGWALSAFSDSDEVGMAVTLLLVFPGVAWVYGRYLKRSDGNAVGLLIGTKILALGIAIVLVLIGLATLVFDLLKTNLIFAN